MFTGIVERGEIVRAEGNRVTAKASFLADCEIGASVAINGVCLTVTDRDGDACTFDLAEETRQRTALGDLTAGERVNLERPVRAGAELGGHVVQGHVDGVGAIASITPDGNGVRVRVDLPDGMDRYIVEKGSVTVDGVSLTVTDVDNSSFEVALIPHTLEVTTFGDAAVGRRVNLEVDVLAKYVEKLVANARATR